MDRNKNSLVLGVILIVLGVIFLGGTFGIVSLSWKLVGFIAAVFWPLALLIPGLLMHYSFFSGKSMDAGMLVPAGIFTTIGGLFLINTIFGWWLMAYLWPVFIASVAIGLFELYLFGNREKGLLIPVGILGGISGLFLSITISQLVSRILGGSLIAVVLIVIGILVITRNNRGRGSF